MLRNRTERIFAGPGAGMLVAGTNYVGLLGSDLLATTADGDNGAGIFANDQAIVPSRRYRAVVVSSSFAPGSMELREDGSGWANQPGRASLLWYEGNLLVTAAGSRRLLVVEIGDAPPDLTRARVVRAEETPRPHLVADIDVADSVLLYFDFAPLLGREGLVIDSLDAVTISIDVRGGFDPAPATRRVGAARLLSNGLLVEQRFAAGVEPVDYAVRCVAIDSAGQPRVAVAVFGVRRF